MKFFKYALLSVRSNLLINLMMIAEITAVLLGANLMVGGYNNRNMLKKPYGEILEKNGWYVVCEMGDRNELVIPDDLHGDLKIITMDNYIFSDKNIPVRVKICPDEIIKNMKLPVRSGKWRTSSDKEIVCIAAPNNFDISAGDKLTLHNGSELSVCGLLTDPCYIPDFSGWQVFEGIDQNFYSKHSKIYYDKNSESESLILIMSASEFAKTGIKNVFSDHSVIMYGDALTADDIKHNEEVFSENGGIAIPLGKLKERADLSVRNLMVKYLPVMLCMFAVIIIGFISCTSINTLKQMKNFGTLFICGMDWGSCLTICCAYTVIIISCSAVVTAAVYAVGKAMNISANLGLAFELNNVLITASIIGLLFLLNMIIPVFIINRRSPVEIIKEGSL